MQSEAEGRGIYSRPRAHFFSVRTDKEKYMTPLLFFSAGFLSPAFPPMTRKKNQETKLGPLSVL